MLDEFDALAKKRVANALLQMIGDYRGKSLLIAATRRERILSAAGWRRFDEVLAFEPPNLEQLRRLLAVKLRGLRREFETDDARIAGLFEGMSHADAERVIQRAAKDMILSEKELLSEGHLRAAIRRENARRTKAKGS